MTIKITSKNFKSDVFRRVLTALLFFASTALFSQVTVTNVFPIWVTTGSTVTVRGTGFTPSLASSITLSNITIGSRTYISPMEMSFVITQSTLGVSGDSDGTLSVGGVSGGIINYIGPREVELVAGSNFLVKEIYTNWNYNGRGFWSSRDYADVDNGASKHDMTVAMQSASPNDKHELLGYRVSNGVSDIIYSTGVHDSLLEAKLVEYDFLVPSDLTDPGKYRRSVFKAYSTNGVSGVTRSDTFIIAADMMDGIPFGSGENFSPEQFNSLTAIKDLTVLEAIIDGKNGLELGTGITNFNRDDEVQFFSGNGKPGAIDDDGAPDLLITQIADAGAPDIYYYADPFNNVVGRPVRLVMHQYGALIPGTPTPILSRWKMNLYTFAGGQPFAMATPNARSTDDWITPPFRDIRMAAFTLEDFGINTTTDVGRIENINLSAGGSADIAFMAYNAASFDIKGPVAAKAVLPQYVCRLDDDSSVTFNVVPGIHVGIEENGAVREPIGSSEQFDYQLWKDGELILSNPNPSFLTVNNIDASKLGVYKIRVESGEGTVIIPVELAEGGVPYVWNGSAWGPINEEYEVGGVEVEDKNKNLFFASSYSGDEDLEGCDCYVASGANVTIGTGKIMKLYGKIEVAIEIQEDPVKEIPSSAPGTFTLENNASLIQTKEVTTNENSGDILAKRSSKNLKKYDFVYWSSPVDGGKFSQIPGSSNNIYQWSVNATNPQQRLGNWVPVSGASTMENARGYIKREDNLKNVDAVFEGVPNNGLITIEVEKTGTPSSSMNEIDKHSNLIGNPYPSAINAITFLDKNKDVLDGKVLIWDSNIGERGGGANNPFYENFKYNYSDQYITYNKTGTNDPEGFKGYIASGQGFIVKVLPAATELNVKFDNSMRFGEDYNNSEFLRSSDLSTSTEKQLIWLALVNENSMASNILVGYAEGATNGKDHMYDAVSGSGGMRIYSILDDSDLLIQGRALPFQDSDEVPLGVELLNNGIYKIGIAQVKGSLVSDAAQGIYLEDTYNNIIHDLRKTPYSFTGIAGNIKDRFILRYTNTTLSVDGPQLSDTFVYVKNDQLHVKASKNIERVLVYDLSGKKLMDYKVNGNTDAIQTTFQFPKGVYLTEIKLETVGTITKKIMN